LAKIQIAVARAGQLAGYGRHHHDHDQRGDDQDERPVGVIGVGVIADHLWAALAQER
jgi:hypothetical protein